MQKESEGNGGLLSTGVGIKICPIYMSLFQKGFSELAFRGFYRLAIESDERCDACDF